MTWLLAIPAVLALITLGLFVMDRTEARVVRALLCDVDKGEEE